MSEHDVRTAYRLGILFPLRRPLDEADAERPEEPAAGKTTEIICLVQTIYLFRQPAVNAVY